MKFGVEPSHFVQRWKAANCLIRSSVLQRLKGPSANVAQCASWRKESKFARISKRRLSRFKRCHVSRLHFRRLHFGCRRNSPEWQTSRAVVERLQYIWNGKKSDKEVQSMPHFVKCFKMSTQLQACLCWLVWFGSWATDWWQDSNSHFQLLSLSGGNLWWG